jgi:hypothetical protein
LVTCGRDNTITIWTGNGTKVRTLKSAGELPLRAVFSQDGKRIFGTDFEGRVQVWDASEAAAIATLNANPS